MRIVSRCLKESESQAGGKNQEQLWPFPPQRILGPRTLLLLCPFLNSFPTRALMKKISGDQKQQEGT